MAEHGTRRRYQNGCRCDPCKESSAEYHRARYVECVSCGGRKSRKSPRCWECYNVTRVGMDEPTQGSTCDDCGAPCSPNSRRCKLCYLALETRPKEERGIPLTQFPGGTGDSVREREEFSSALTDEFESSESVFRGICGPMREGKGAFSWKTV